MRKAPDRVRWPWGKRSNRGFFAGSTARQILFSVLAVCVASAKKRRDSTGNQNGQERNNRNKGEASKQL